MESSRPLGASNNVFTRVRADGAIQGPQRRSEEGRQRSEDQCVDSEKLTEEYFLFKYSVMRKYDSKDSPRGCRRI